MSAASTSTGLSASTENLLQSGGDETNTKPTITTTSAGGGGGGADTSTSTSAAGAGAVKTSSPPYSSTTYLFTESEPFRSASAGYSKPSTSAVAISNAAAEAAQLQQSNRNRIPLAMCSQQTAVSTPGASLSVDETPIMISTDEDTDQTTSLILPVGHGQNITATTSQIISSNRIDPLINAESTRSVPELELHSRTRNVALRIAGGGSTDKYSVHSDQVSSSVPSNDGLMCRHR
jgi:hypothetical protein